jgi:hypothetical protein
MKKLLLIVLATFGVSAYAAILKSEVTEGMKKVCIYSDGSAKTVSSASLCPLTN